MVSFSHYNSMLRYVRIELFVSIFIMGVIVYILRDRIYTSFLTNVYLNGAIIGVIIYNIFQIVLQAFRLHHSADSLKNLELHIEGQLEEDQWKRIKKQFFHDDSYLNILVFHDFLKTSQTPQSIAFNEAEGADLKNRLRDEIDDERNAVNYFIGVLIILGLMGTFWGLLGTIGSIGDTLTNISHTFQDDQTDGNPISDFIIGIREPLKGMSVAFSSSLFGLAGSVTTGFLSFLLSTIQNKFKSDFNNWVDAHTTFEVPGLTGGGRGYGGGFGPANLYPEMNYMGADDTAAMFGMIGQMLQISTASNQQTAQLVSDISELIKQQDQKQALSNDMADALTSLKGIQENILNAIQGSHKTSAEMLELMEKDNVSTNAINAEIKAVKGLVSSHVSASQTAASNNKNAIEDLRQTTDQLRVHLQQATDHHNILFTNYNELMQTREDQFVKHMEHHIELRKEQSETLNKLTDHAKNIEGAHKQFLEELHTLTNSLDNKVDRQVNKVISESEALFNRLAKESIALQKVLKDAMTPAIKPPEPASDKPDGTESL